MKIGASQVTQIAAIIVGSLVLLGEAVQNVFDPRPSSGAKY